PGLHGRCRRIYAYVPQTHWAPMNQLATVGAGILGTGVLLFIINVFWSRRSGLIAGSDPWRGQSLEWATTSPPPVYNFLDIPTVQTGEPLGRDTPVMPAMS